MTSTTPPSCGPSSTTGVDTTIRSDSTNRSITSHPRTRTTAAQTLSANSRATASPQHEPTALPPAAPCGILQEKPPAQMRTINNHYWLIICDTCRILCRIAKTWSLQASRTCHRIPGRGVVVHPTLARVVRHHDGRYLYRVINTGSRIRRAHLRRLHQRKGSVHDDRPAVHGNVYSSSNPFER